MAHVDMTRLILPEAQAAEAREAQARAYLSATDWMVLRAAETGTPVPEDIRAARAEARACLSSG